MIRGDRGTEAKCSPKTSLALVPEMAPSATSLTNAAQLGRDVRSVAAGRRPLPGACIRRSPSWPAALPELGAGGQGFFEQSGRGRLVHQNGRVVFRQPKLA